MRLNLADGRPFALVTVWCPEELGGAFTREQLTEHSFHDLLEVPLGHGVQTIAAAAASVRGSGAELLEIAVEGSPVLVCERTTYDTSERAVLPPPTCSPASSPSSASTCRGRRPRSRPPSGIRLVE